MGPLHQIKGDLNLFFFKAFPAWICFKFTQLISTILLCILCKYEANPCRESFKKIDLNLLLFDVGGPSSLVMAGIQVNFKLWPIFCSIYLIPYIKSEARTEFSGLFYIDSKIFSFQTGLLHGLHL